MVSALRESSWAEHRELMKRIPRGIPGKPARAIPRAVPVSGLEDMTLDWTNDQSVMEISLYFNPAGPDLAMSYNVCGLQPVIRQVHGTQYLLKDEANNFYRWDSDEPGMYLIVNATNLEEALDAIIYHPFMMDTELL